MAQISRPFQIGLVVVVLLAGVWLFALHGHSNGSTSANSAATPAVTSTVSPSSTPASHPATPSHATKAGVEAAHAAAPTPVDHGSAPGVEGLTRAVAKAHEAVATSQRDANELEHKSREASNEATQSSSAAAPASSAASSSTSTTRTGAPATTSSTHAASTSTSTVHKGSTAASTAASASATATPSGQREVEAEMKQGKIVVLLFWNPAGSDDVVVHNEVRLLLKFHHDAAKANAEEGRHVELDKRIAVHEARASQVASYGSVTRGVQIYGTPTLLVINPKGQVITLTGITDAYSIEQAIEEARAG